MKLTKVRIQNFRSIALTDFPIERDLTAIIGENEHGKTNLLSSVKLLDFQTPIQDMDVRFSRKDEGKNKKNTTTSLVYHLELSDEEVAYLRTVILTQKFSKKNKSHPKKKETKPILGKDKGVKIPEEIKLQVDYLDGRTNFYAILGVEKDIDKIFLDFIRSALGQAVFYFDSFEECLKHKIPHEEVVERRNNITNGLIKLAGLKGKEKLIFKDTPQARQMLIDSSKVLTENVRKLWKQGRDDEIELMLNVSNDGKYLNVDIGDPNTYGTVSSRSRGFLFFLSFILKFKECNDGDFKDLIILIDEPGIFLHPKGQENLLSYLEDLSKYNQVVYTTHSPFMVKNLKNGRIRIVKKQKEKGTMIQVQPYGNLEEVFGG